MNKKKVVNREPKVPLPKEKLDPAYAMIQKYVPEFAGIKVEDVETNGYFSMSASIISFIIPTRKVVYKHKHDLFFDGFFKTFYPQVIKAIQDSGYGTGIVYSSEDGTTMIENYVEGVVCRPNLLDEEEQTVFLLSAAKETAHFLNCVQSAYDPAFPFNKYKEILNNGVMDLF
jgi:hypothetical protein